MPNFPTLEERVAAQQVSIEGLKEEVRDMRIGVDLLTREVRASREEQIRSEAEKLATRRISNIVYLAVSFVVSTVMPVLIYFMTKGDK